MPIPKLQDYPDPLTVGEGERLRVFGCPFIQYNKKRKTTEPGLAVSNTVGTHLVGMSNVYM